MIGNIGRVLFVCSIIFGCVAANDILRSLFLKNEHEPVIYVHYVDETGFVNELISYIDLSAQGETEGPIRSFLMFIEPSKFAALQNSTVSQLWVRDYLIEQFEAYCTDHGFEAPSVLFLIASYDGTNANYAAEISRIICSRLFDLRMGAVSLLLTGSAQNGVSNEDVDQLIRTEFEHIMTTIPGTN